MNLSTLFTMQRALDTYIEQQQKVEQEDLFVKKSLALLVELAELANETRCFKFWSRKEAAAKAVILEEYVDSIHFLLSLGIEKNFDHLTKWPEETVKGTLTELFLLTGQAIHTFLNETTMDHYIQLWIYYGAIAKELGFENTEIIQAYIDKNEENYARQKRGY